MSTGWVEACLVGVPLNLDWGAVWGGVRGLTLCCLGLEIFLAGVLQGSLLLNGDSVTCLVAEIRLGEFYFPQSS